ncbi:MAG: single-stranded-DNA-specific exonuclease RecJ [Sedimentisphaerales bacterium]|nr:single-stranded-DNA-specific exonuclease RecJ [Sedimentisphaerales bacterium]
MAYSARMQTKPLANKSRLAARPNYRKQRKDFHRLKKHWVIYPPDDRRGQLTRLLKISPVLAQVLLNRGITDVHSAASFLRPKLTELIEPEQMPGVRPAVARISKAINTGQKISIYGDYDVDGITGVTILWQILKLLGAEVEYYIPHRIEEGYGLNPEAVRSLADSGSKLLITVDCGITALKPAELAGQMGVELIITDHHKPGPKLPEVSAIVHPALDESYPNPHSSGSMVAFKLAWALAKEFTAGGKLQPRLRQFMLNATSLASMGTIADVVDLRGENRILTSFGLKSLPESNLLGVRALIESAGLTGRGLDSYDIGFRLAPMLNAAGRMGHARLAVELLTSESEAQAMEIAEYLRQQNSQRQRRELKIFQQACEMIEQKGLSKPDHRSVVLANDNWHSGIIGIVASRIVDKYCRPTVMISKDQSAARGSARSVAGFDILAAIRACSQHLLEFGGHEMAAGITIETEKIEKFTADFEAYARGTLGQDDITPKLRIDAEVDLCNFDKRTVGELRILEPFGQGNPRAVFATKAVQLACPPRTVGAKNEHLQLAVTDNTASIRCIGFGMGRLEKKLLEQDFFSIAYQPQLNTFNGSTNVQLVIVDIKFE